MVYFPEEQAAEVYTPEGDVETVVLDGVLSGGDVLPGSNLNLRRVFRPAKA